MRAVRTPPRRVQGILLPLVALALSLGGAAWLVAMTGAGRSTDADLDGADTARARLLDARRALIAHASAYPDAYGPLGAGPGHLVCPDTDTPLERAPTLPGGRAGDDFGGDGPNPPCGGGSLAVGRLPRHASPDGRRRLFHGETSQRFVYGVSTGHVNNPPGRAVRHARASGSIAAEVVAVIVDPGGATLSSATLAGARDPLELLARVRSGVAREAGADTAGALPHVFLTHDELRAAAVRRVAAWFVETANDVARRHGTPGSTGDDPHGPASAIVCPGDAPHESLRRVGDRDTDDCAMPDTIENTPRERHWFVREGWFRDVAVRREGACHGRAPVACRFELAPSDGRRHDGEAIAPPGGTEAEGETAARVTGTTIEIALVPIDPSVDLR